MAVLCVWLLCYASIKAIATRKGVLLAIEGGPSVESAGRRYTPKERNDLMTLNWVKQSVSCASDVDID
jgi:hypothetical protein